MKRPFIALACATIVAGCATTYSVQPVADASQTPPFRPGATTADFDGKDMAVRVTALGFNSHRQIKFGLAVVNKSDHPISFGYGNIGLADAAGRPIAVYDGATLKHQAANRALVKELVLGVLGGLAAVSADDDAYSAPSGPYGTRTYEPGVAAATTAAVTTTTGAGIDSIQQGLDQTTARIKGRILTPATINPGQSYGGVIVGDRLKGPYPEVVALRVSGDGMSHEFRFNVSVAQKAHG